MTAVTPTDRPKSVRNRCVIEFFGGVFYVVTLSFGFFCGVGAFVIGPSPISSFLSCNVCVDFFFNMSRLCKNFKTSSAIAMAEVTRQLPVRNVVGSNPVGEIYKRNDTH